jgi:hypothetical protein
MKIFSKILRAIVITLAIVLLLPFCFTIIKMLLEGDEGAITVLSVCLSFVLSTYINVIVHEGGHLVFGLLCGYRFSSFRVGSIMMIKQGGMMKLRSYSLAGTDGQCLMIPPSRESTKAEMILYNMGGVIFNIILVILCLGLNYIVPETFILTDTIRICCLISALLVLTNGIPLNMGGIANDGMNALHLSKNPVAAESFRKT